uniref:Secreted protein n=1 Tax=Oryza barthii TaxID=65489 RepID=A0A0D3EP18_9ORYZ
MVMQFSQGGGLRRRWLASVAAVTVVVTVEAVATSAAGKESGARACVVVEHRCVSRRFAGGEQRVKTQSGLGRTDNDVPLLRALSCCLTPQG